MASQSIATAEALLPSPSGFQQRSSPRRRRGFLFVAILLAAAMLLFGAMIVGNNGGGGGGGDGSEAPAAQSTTAMAVRRGRKWKWIGGDPCADEYGVLERGIPSGPDPMHHRSRRIRLHN